MPVRRGNPLRYAAQKDSNHRSIESELEQLGFLVIDTSKLGNFVDLVIKHPAKPEVGVKMIEIKTKKGKLKPEQQELKDLWQESIIEARIIDDILVVFGFL